MRNSAGSNSDERPGSEPGHAFGASRAMKTSKHVVEACGHVQWRGLKHLFPAVAQVGSTRRHIMSSAFMDLSCVHSTPDYNVHAVRHSQVLTVPIAGSTAAAVLVPWSPKQQQGINVQTCGKGS